MIPKFDTLQDLSGFLRALPANANYGNMLKEDFGLEAPEDAVPYQKEYLWKYLVQGTYKGMTGDYLMLYAQASVEKLVKILPDLKNKGITIESQILADALDTPISTKIQNITGFVPVEVPAPVPMSKIASKKAKASKPVVAAAPKTPAKAPAKVPDAPKVVSVKAKYPDFSIVRNEKRGGFDGFYQGKAEAFRPTAEKVSAFFVKKYGKEGVLVA
jgi:hypothetical protein